MKQWIERLATFLKISPNEIGYKLMGYVSEDGEKVSNQMKLF